MRIDGLPETENLKVEMSGALEKLVLAFSRRILKLVRISYLTIAIGL